MEAPINSENLDNLLKKAEIQKKLIEIEKDKAEINISNVIKHQKDELELMLLKVEIEKKKIEVEKEKFALSTSETRRLEFEEKNLVLFQVSVLNHILSDITVDSERTLFAGEPFLTNTLTGNGRNIVREKMIELVKKI